MNRPIGIYLLLWPTLSALWLASDGRPSLHFVAVFVLGTTLMRAGGCAINDFADRHVDGQVARTRDRPLATGELRARNAVWTFVVLSLLALALALTLPSPAWPLLLPAALVAFLYPFTKRWIQQPQAVLGIAFGFGIPIAFAAAKGEVTGLGWFLFLMNFFWVLAYDTLYAMCDRPDDLKVGIKSTAVWLGDHDLWVVSVWHAVHMVGWIWIGLSENLGGLFWLGFLVAAGLVIRQMWRVRDREPQVCLWAFLNNHWVGFSLFLGVVGGTWI